MEVGVPRTYYGVVYQLDYDDLYLWGWVRRKSLGVHLRSPEGKSGENVVR
jgi:hypothetical protein